MDTLLPIVYFFLSFFFFFFFFGGGGLFNVKFKLFFIVFSPIFRTKIRPTLHRLPLMWRVTCKHLDIHTALHLYSNRRQFQK